MTTRGRGLGRDGNLTWTLDPPWTILSLIDDVNGPNDTLWLQAKKNTESQEKVLWSTVYEVHNIQWNTGLPQKLDARDIYFLFKIIQFNFDKTSLRSASPEAIWMYGTTGSRTRQGSRLGRNVYNYAH